MKFAYRVSTNAGRLPGEAEAGVSVLETCGTGAGDPGRGGLGVRQHCLQRNPRESGRGAPSAAASWTGKEGGPGRAGPGRRRRWGAGRPARR